VIEIAFVAAISVPLHRFKSKFVVQERRAKTKLVKAIKLLSKKGKQENGVVTVRRQERH